MTDNTEMPPANGRSGETMSPAEVRALTKRLMKRQVALSLKISGVFVAILLGLPLLNLYLPETMGSVFGGFTLTWLVLGVLFYPLTWWLSQWFVHGSEAIEADIVREEGTR